MTAPTDDSQVATIESVMDEMIELQPMIPPSSVFPMLLAGEEQNEAIALASKLTAIQMIHGATPAYVKEYLGEVLGFNQLTSNAVEPTKDMIVACARNLLSGVERRFAGTEPDELRVQLSDNGVFEAAMIEPMLTRIEEVAYYCQDNNIGPYDHESAPPPNQPSDGKKTTRKEAIQTAFKDLALGQDFDGVMAKLTALRYNPGEEILAVLWLAVRQSQGNETQVYQAISQLPSDGPTANAKELYSFGVSGVNRAKRHRASRTMTNFLSVGRKSGKLGCLLPPIAGLLFIGLLFTPLAWWLSLVIAFVAMFGMGFLRVTFDSLFVKSTAKTITKEYAADSEDYAILHRLLSQANTWEENEGSDLGPLLERLPAPTATPSDDAAPQSSFHGFFYTGDPETGAVVALEMSPLQQHAFEELTSGEWQALPEEEYWKSYFRVTMMPAHQGYIAWNNKSYWIFATDQTAVHVIEFSNGSIRHQWRETGESGRIEGRFRNLLDVLRHWSVHQAGRRSQRPLSEPLLNQLDQNIAWTDELHERLGALYPL